MPIYSPNHSDYLDRVHAKGRSTDPTFLPTEPLYRRIPPAALLGDKIAPIALQFKADTGHSVNRGKYCKPQDVLESDCCEGAIRLDQVVMELRVADLPEQLQCSETGKSLRFCMKHVPKETCFAHSEIWCNKLGDASLPYDNPTKTIKDLFRAHIVRRCTIRRFTPHTNAE